MKLGILTEKSGTEISYIQACKDLHVNYEIVDFVSNDWWDNVKYADCDGFLVRASGDCEVNKRMFNERIYLIEKYLKKPVYPNYDSIMLYENKKVQSYWLKIHNMPHPETWIFYIKDEALEFLKNRSQYPIVFKPNLGAQAEGVKYVENKSQGIRIINRIFTKWLFFNRGYTRWRKVKRYFRVPVMDDRQFNFVMFQEYIHVKVEWRIIKVGQSYFGYQKLLKGKFHSGSHRFGHVQPPKILLEMTKKIALLGGFSSISIDIFEDQNGKYYINEMQTFWGGGQDSKMIIDGKPCRYRDINGEWLLEEGIYNQNRSCNLKVLDFLDQLSQKDKF
jgi:glutathione synthase/RimK-type ligase-like ATP-grasp enzyme